uniref:Transmembrane protein n=1 Tax=Noccaea caerulescens TaxID=107243 RepID=A0A1J3D0L6_NOCCA
MVRGGLAVAAGNGGGSQGTVILLYIWAAVIALSVIATVIFSCSDGASKSQTNDVNGSACAAGCGGGCGG